MTSPRVSIVLPTRNRAGLLRRAMAGVLAQTFRDFELIIVDDGSSEDIAAVAAACGDARVRCIRIEPRGPGAARNEGLRIARGELCAFHDSDDQWLVAKLEQQVAALDGAPAAVLCCCGYLIDHETGRPRYVAPRADRLTEAAVLAHFAFFPPMWLGRREALLHAGLFDETLPTREDWELAIRLRALGPFVGIDRPGVIKSTAPDTVSANLPAHVVSLSRILERHAARFAAHPRALAEHRRELGALEVLFGDPAAGRRQLWRSGHWGWWAASLLGRDAARAVHRTLQRRARARRIESRSV